MTKIYLPNVGDLAEIQRASYFNFLTTGIVEELKHFPNPLLVMFSRSRVRDIETQLQLPKPNLKIVRIPGQKQNLEIKPQRYSKRMLEYVYLYLETPIFDTIPEMSLNYATTGEHTYGINVFVHSYYKENVNRVKDPQLYKDFVEKLIKLEKKFEKFPNRDQILDKIKAQGAIIFKRLINFGQIPLMTDDGTFIINGCERIVVNQIIRSPGVYFRKEFSPSRKVSYTATLISDRGSWTKIILDTGATLKSHKFGGDNIELFDRVYIKLAEFKEKYTGIRAKKTDLNENKIFFSDLLKMFGIQPIEFFESIKYPERLFPPLCLLQNEMLETESKFSFLMTERNFQRWLDKKKKPISLVRPIFIRPSKKRPYIEQLYKKYDRKREIKRQEKKLTKLVKKIYLEREYPDKTEILDYYLSPAPYISKLKPIFDPHVSKPPSLKELIAKNSSFKKALNNYNIHVQNFLIEHKEVIRQQKEMLHSYLLSNPTEEKNINEICYDPLGIDAKFVKFQEDLRKKLLQKYFKFLSRKIPEIEPLKKLEGVELQKEFELENKDFIKHREQAISINLISWLEKYSRLDPDYFTKKLEESTKVGKLGFLLKQGLIKIRKERFNDGLKQIYYLDEYKNHPDSLYQRIRTKWNGFNPSIRPRSDNYDEFKEYLINLFLDHQTGIFSIGEGGRYRVNKRLGLNLPPTCTSLTIIDLVEVVNGLMELKYENALSDDIDHIKNKQIRSIGELLKIQVRSALYKATADLEILEETGIYELGSMSTYKHTPIRDNLIFRARPIGYPDPDYLTFGMQEFFNSSQLSQYMDQTNPLSEITQKRKISVFGPNGLKRDNISPVVRDIHPTQYGKLCPVETPEGKNAGLVTSLAMFAKHKPVVGWIETPYFLVQNTKVFANYEPLYINPEEESHTKVAFADVALTKESFIPKEVEYLSTKENYSFALTKSKEIELLTMTPLQIISLATTLIPFVEHNDANRALMGANMQRQAVPLIITQKPLVGTGMETAAVLDCGMIVKTYCQGKVLHACSSCIKIQDTSGQIILYNLRKVAKSNQETCINQKPIVWSGEIVFSNQIIADGPATKGGELAVGRNFTIAYMPWDGYNYEDAIIINESLITKNLLTSIHIEKYGTEVNHGTEKVTRKISAVTKYSRRHLDRTGVARVGSYVKPDDILVGRITPVRQDLSGETKLYRAVMGIKAPPIKDISFRVPHGTHGRIISIDVSSDDLLDPEDYTYDRIQGKPSHPMFDARVGYEHSFREIQRILKKEEPARIFLEKLFLRLLKDEEALLYRIENNLSLEDIVKERIEDDVQALLTYRKELARIKKLRKPRKVRQKIKPKKNKKESEVSLAKKIEAEIESNLDADIDDIIEKNIGTDVEIDTDFPEDEDPYLSSILEEDPEKKIPIVIEIPGVILAVPPDPKDRKRENKHHLILEEKIVEQSINDIVDELVEKELENEKENGKEKPKGKGKKKENQAEKKEKQEEVLDEIQQKIKELKKIPSYEIYQTLIQKYAILRKELKELLNNDIKVNYKTKLQEYVKRPNKLKFFLIHYNKTKEIRFEEAERVQEKLKQTLKAQKDSFSSVQEIKEIYDKIWEGYKESLKEERKNTIHLQKRLLTEFRSIVLGKKSRFEGAAFLKFYIAETRKIQVGDKLSGRHGNKGIISRILPTQDMPFLPDGTPLDIILNPLGVPSRMNVGQVFESLLGLAGEKLGRRFKILPFDEIYGKEASRILVNQKLKEASLKTGIEWLFNSEHPGKMLLRDGRTGDFFDNPITVGRSYILKLIHLVEDKIHARSTGPYAKITEQPLKGKRLNGGQRFGEMEVWALEAYGCSYTLQELLTVKSDDIDGRVDMYSSILTRRNVEKPLPNITESFLLLVRELNALGLNFSFHKIDTKFANPRHTNIKIVNHLEQNIFQSIEDRLSIRALLMKKKGTLYPLNEDSRSTVPASPEYLSKIKTNLEKQQTRLSLLLNEEESKIYPNKKI